MGAVSGLDFNMDEETYHRHPTSLSASGAKVLLRSPALFDYQRRHPKKPSAAMDLGSVVHSMLLGGPHFVAIDGNRNANAVKEKIAEAEAEGFIVLKSEQLDAAKRAVDQVQHHKLASQLLAGIRTEVSAFAVCDDSDVLRRGRFDGLGKGYILDLKTAIDPDPRVFGRKAADFGYHIQAGNYLDLAQALDLDVSALCFVVVGTEAPHNVSVVELDDPATTRGRDLMREACQTFKTCTDDDKWPTGWGDGLRLVSLPPWALRDNDYTEEITA